jgi:hypothetical protein
MQHTRFNERGNEDPTGNHLEFYQENEVLTSDDYEYVGEEIINIFKAMPIFDLSVTIVQDADNIQEYTFVEIIKFLKLERTIHELTAEYLNNNLEYTKVPTKSARNNFVTDLI